MADDKARRSLLEVLEVREEVRDNFGEELAGLEVREEEPADVEQAREGGGRDIVANPGEEELVDLEEARDVADDEARRAGQPGPADDERRRRRKLGIRLVGACEKGSVEEVADLLRRGADVNCTNWRGETALLWAVRKGDADAVAELLRRGANVERGLSEEVSDNYWLTDARYDWPLEQAAQYGRMDVVRALLEHGADVNRTDKRGKTAMLVAAREGHIDTFNVLLEKAGEKISPPVLAAVLSESFVKDGSDPIDMADALLKRVAGQGVDDSQAAFAECRAPGGLDIWFDKGSAKEMYADWNEKARLVKSVNGDPLTVLCELDHTKWPGRLFNRFSRPVKADLCEARSVTMDVLDDRKVMDALATASNLELFNTELVECMVRYMWDTVALWAYLDICMNAGIVASACAASAALSRGEDVDGLSWTILVAATSKRVAEEFAQLCHALRSAAASQVPHPLCDECLFIWIAFKLMFLLSRLIGYALQLDTVLDTAFIWLSVVSLRSLDEADDVSPSNRFVLALWFALLWLRLLYSLRVLKLVGPRFLPIFYTIRGTLGFYFVVAFTFAASVHSYYTLAVRDYPGPFYAAFVQMFKLYFLGDFDLQELEGVDPSYVQTSGAGARLILEPRDPDASENYAFVHGIFYAVALLFAVVLMNLFIGILGAEYDIQEDVAIPVFLQSRVVAAAKYRSLPWVGACSWVYRRLARHDGKRHLCALVRCAPSDDATRSLRSHLSLTERKINTKIETLDRNMKEKIETLDQKMDVLLKRLNAGAALDNTASPAAPGAAEDDRTVPTVDR